MVKNLGGNKAKGQARKYANNDKKDNKYLRESEAYKLLKPEKQLKIEQLFNEKYNDENYRINPNKGIEVTKEEVQSRAFFSPLFVFRFFRCSLKET